METKQHKNKNIIERVFEMTERIKKLYAALEKKMNNEKAKKYEGLDISSLDCTKAAELFKGYAETVSPFIYDGDTIGFNRIDNCRTFAGGGNITPNYARIISGGFKKALNDIKNSKKNADSHQKKYADAMLLCIDTALAEAEKYRAYAKEKSPRLYNALNVVPENGAVSFYEACVFMKFCIYILRLSGMTHVTLGRFDQYMYPYYKADLEKGISEDELFETLEEFFISINFDSALYSIVQPGDDGQSMVLGGYDLQGNDMFNPLSKACIDASIELSLIDPKINVRVNKNTPIERYEYLTLLTKKGLGFPQYLNDDTVVPGLVALGYAREDAINYSVAACWEFIVSGCGFDIPNITTFDFPKVTNNTIRKYLVESDSFEVLLDHTKLLIKNECDRIVNEINSAWNKNTIRVSPMAAVFTDNCIENLTEAFDGAKYHNYGCHGAGISTAADSLAAVKKVIFDDKSITKECLLNALENNFKGYENVRNMLLSCPKMGQNDDYVDDIATVIMKAFADNINGRPNGIGGIWRGGTGSAHEYIYTAEKCPATADGRYAFQPYASSFSPSPDSKTNGLLSVIMSFTKFDQKNLINGGPLTIEIHDTVLRNDIGIKKTALLISEFIKRGGHELQINSVNRNILIDAQKNPEKYPNLIVRVWGWSGYFNELDPRFQNHIINRTEFVN